MKYLREVGQNSDASLMPPDEFKTRRQLKNTATTGKETKTDQQLNFNIKFQKKEAEEFHGVQRFKKAAHVIQDVIMLEHFSSNQEEDWILRKEAGVVFWINKNTGEVTTIKPWETSRDRRRANTAPAGARRHGLGTTITTTTTASAAANRFGAVQQGADFNVHGFSSVALNLRKNTIDNSAQPKHVLDAGNVSDDNDDDDASVEKQEQAEIELGTGSLVYDGSEIENLFALLDEAK